MISNLPRDVIEEILCRVPVTSLRQLRSTCKGWYHHAIFKDRGFIKKHFDKSERQYYDVMMMDFRVYSVSSNGNGIHVNLSSSLLLEGKHSFIDPVCNTDDNQVYISQAFHCDGLLLCKTVSIDHGSRYVVWNPFSGQTRWIESNNLYQRMFEVYALGYDNSDLCHSYKILRIDVRHQRSEIYEFSSNSWRNLDVSPHGSLVTSGVSLNGNTYWVCGRYRVNEYSLLRFDFLTETFQHMCVPFHGGEVAIGYSMALSVVREEYLSLFLYHGMETRKIEIWTTKEIDDPTHTHVSWSKFLTVDVKPHMMRRSTNPISFFIDEEKKVAVYCQRTQHSKNTVYIVGEDDYYKEAFSFYEFYIECCECWPTVFTYVPRLV